LENVGREKRKGEDFLTSSEKKPMVQRNWRTGKKVGRALPKYDRVKGGDGVMCPERIHRWCSVQKNSAGWQNKMSKEKKTTNQSGKKKEGYVS